MNTRINPTTYAGPTLGHAYMALVNEHMAHATGGRFIFRAANGQADWLDKFSVQQMTDTAYRWLELFAWLGLRVDRICMQSDLEDDCAYAIQHILPGLTAPTKYEPVDFPNDNGQLYPDASWLTAEVAWWDHRNGVDHLIAGDDLRGRFGAYRLVEWLFGYKKFPHTYLPRLVDEDGGISKTNGKWKLADLKARGWGRDDVLNLLRRSCLDDPDGAWHVDNVKPQPRLLMPGRFTYSDAYRRRAHMPAGATPLEVRG